MYAVAVGYDVVNLHLAAGSTPLLLFLPKEACHMDSVLLLKTLAEGGHSTSLMKLQFCSLKVTYLGHVLSEGQRMFAPERLILLNNINYCRHWICDYAAMDSVMRAATLQEAPL